jgi:hypothetical protein
MVTFSAATTIHQVKIDPCRFARLRAYSNREKQASLFSIGQNTIFHHAKTLLSGNLSTKARYTATKSDTSTA